MANLLITHAMVHINLEKYRCLEVRNNHYIEAQVSQPMAEANNPWTEREFSLTYSLLYKYNQQ